MAACCLSKTTSSFHDWFARCVASMPNSNAMSLPRSPLRRLLSINIYEIWSAFLGLLAFISILWEEELPSGSIKWMTNEGMRVPSFFPLSSPHLAAWKKVMAAGRAPRARTSFLPACSRFALCFVTLLTREAEGASWSCSAAEVFKVMLNNQIFKYRVELKQVGNEPNRDLWRKITEFWMICDMWSQLPLFVIVFSFGHTCYNCHMWLHLSCGSSPSIKFYKVLGQLTN